VEDAQLRAILLGPEPPFERRDPGGHASRVSGDGPVLARDEREARVDERLAERHLAGHVVVAARVGDAAAQHRAVLAEHDSLGGGRAEVDADGVVHEAAPSRFWSSIWKYDSSRFLMLAAEK